jgi:PilZ domain
MAWKNRRTGGKSSGKHPTGETTAAHRGHPRAPLNVYINKIVGESLYMCRAANISEEGIYVSRLLEPDSGRPDFGLEFVLPGNDEVLWARGQVVRRGRKHEVDGTGVHFTVIPERYRKMIADYVGRHENGGT